MPSLAFAGAHDSHSYPIDVDGSANWDAIQTVLAGDDAKYVEVVKEPTHSETGLMNVTCKVDYCAEVAKDVEIPTINHTLVARDITIEQFAAAMLAQKAIATTPAVTVSAPFANKYAADKWVRDQKADNMCYVKNAKVCSCGYVLPYADEDPAEVNKVDLVAHNDGGVPHCTDWKCIKCDTTVKGSGHTPKASLLATPGSNILSAAGAAADKVSDPDCGHGTGYLVECDDCAKKVAVGYYGAADTAAHNYGAVVDNSVALVAQKTANTYKVKTGYVAINDGAVVSANDNAGFVQAELTKVKCYKLNDVISEGDCEADTDTELGLKCTVCGDHLEKSASNVVIETVDVDHDYEQTTIPATCDGRSVIKKVCKVCGDAPSTTPATTTDDTLAHNYKVTKVAASCTNSQEYYVIECTTCSKKTDCSHTGVTNAKYILRNNAADGINIIDVTPATADSTKTRTLTWNGFDHELKGTKVMEFTFDLTTAPAHKYNGSETVVKAATCEGDEVWGVKCSVCGKVDIDNVYTKTGTKLGHSVVKNEVAVTCGAAGYYTEECAACAKVKDSTGAWVTPVANTVLKETVTAKPLVKKGASCTFDKWVVTKASTVFEEGVKSLECSVCGADGNAKTVVAKTKYAAPTVKAGKKSATVTVKATADAVSYKISYKKAGGSYKTVSAKVGKKTIKKLAKGKKYTFKVIAVNAEGVEVASATKTVKVK